MLYVSIVNAGQTETNVYLFPGQGSDCRIFKYFKFPDAYKVHCVNYSIPDKHSTIQKYAETFISEIDTTAPVILIGVSLGGMLCTELSDMIQVEKTIIISSAKSRNELPFRYRFQSVIPIYKIVPKQIIKFGALLLQPVVEPDRNKEKHTFKSMLKQKNPLYLKRTIHMIINWDKKAINSQVVHIHGTNDHTIPIRNVSAEYTIEGGSHMMALTRGHEINMLINQIIIKSSK